MSKYYKRTPWKLISIGALVVVIIVLIVFLLLSNPHSITTSSNTILKGNNYSSQILASGTAFSISNQKNYADIPVTIPKTSSGAKLIPTNITGSWSAQNSSWVFFMNQSEFDYFKGNSTQLPTLNGAQYVTGYGDISSGTFYVDLQYYQSSKNINGTDYFVFIYPSNYTGKYYTNITLTSPLVLNGYTTK